LHPSQADLDKGWPVSRSDAAHVAKARGFRTARLNAVKSAILVNLASPGLSIEQVASGLRMSPRYIQMLFHDEETTFSEFVVGQRLAQAWRVLADQRFDDRSITSVAFDCGFGDLSYFNRTFRKRFGCTPSEVRLRCARSGVPVQRATLGAGGRFGGT
jgi:AraC-like DNA-binding protein